MERKHATVVMQEVTDPDELARARAWDSGTRLVSSKLRRLWALRRVLSRHAICRYSNT